MIRVLRHGARTSVKNPVTQQETEMVRVTFVEEGRGGANPSLSKSSSFLDKVTGQKTGLDLQRTHTQAVLADKLQFFAVGAVLNGYINRKMYSTPQMNQQEPVAARMIDGRPTFFVTELDEAQRDDEDHRDSNELVVAIRPQSFSNIRTQTAEVKILQPAVLQEALAVPVGNENLGG